MPPVLGRYLILGWMLMIFHLIRVSNLDIIDTDNRIIVTPFSPWRNLDPYGSE